MVVLKWFILLFIVGIVLGFALQNQDQLVTVKIGWYQSPQIPLFLAIFIAFGTGIFLYFLLSLTHQLKIRGELSRARREYERLQDELNTLRNLNLDKELEEYYKTPPTTTTKPIAEAGTAIREDDEAGWGA
ncbi:MAG: LapA family protein [bacterium]|nr:LapA family protein [bacterium]